MSRAGRCRWWCPAVFGVLLTLLATPDHAAAQASYQRPLGQTLLQRALPGTEALPTSVAPLQLPRRAPITLTPWLGISEEYNDNVFQDNNRREHDFITTFTPGLSFTAEQPTWRFDASYDFDARVYADNSDLNQAFDRQNFTVDAFYRVDPRLTLSVDNAFAYNRGLNAFAPDTSVSTGRTRSWINTIRPGVTWEIDPRTVARGFAAWTTERFDGPGLRDSDTYRADVGLERRLTARLRGFLGYQFAYFDVEQTANVSTHTPRLGLAYEITPTLTASILAGPIVELTEGGDTRLAPFIDATIRKRFAWGEASLTYYRDVGTAGALGGIAENQTIRGSLVVATFLRGLTFEIAPQYRTSDSPEDSSIDVRVLTIPLRAIYQITPYFAVTGGYAFLQQRSDSTLRNPVTGGPLARDVDQNRVFVGVIVGYPVNFD